MPHHDRWITVSRYSAWIATGPARAAVAIVLPRQLRQLSRQRPLLLPVQPTERLERRPVVRPEELHVLLRRAVPEDRRPLAALDRADPTVEDPLQVPLIAPHHRRRQPARLRHVAPHRPEHLADVPLRCPARQRDLPARPAHPQKLRRRLEMVRSEHRPVNRQHRIERPARKRQLLRIPLHEHHAHVLGLGTQLPALEQRRHVVHPHRIAPPPRRRDRRVPAPGRHVQHPPPRLQVRRLAQLLGRQHQPRRHHRKIPAPPRDPLPLLDPLKVGLPCPARVPRRCLQLRCLRDHDSISGSKCPKKHDRSYYLSTIRTVVLSCQP